MDELEKKEGQKYGRVFERFLTDLRDVACLNPRERYLYPILKGVPFQDFHVALQMVVKSNRKVVNDNRKRMEEDYEAGILKEAEEIKTNRKKKKK